MSITGWLLLISRRLPLLRTGRPHVARGLATRMQGSPAALVMLVLLGALPFAARAQQDTVCGQNVKEYVAKTLDEVDQADPEKKAAVEEQLYKQFSYCGTQDAARLPTTDPFHAAARQCGAKVSNLGSLFYEEMPCCGYDPQRRQFACPVKIKQPFGFGPSEWPGSREHVLHCVADAGGVLRPVGRDSVHLSNSVASPSWQFAVIAAATENLQLVQPTNGQERRARSILSWALPPIGCEYQPIWGNALNYKIRLDE